MSCGGPDGGSHIGATRRDCGTVYRPPVKRPSSRPLDDAHAAGDALDPAAPPDYTALDTLLPHPTYAAQLWISILNPSAATFRDVVAPLIAEAHDRLAKQHARHAAGKARRGD